MTRPHIGLDFETYSGVSLPEVGLENYVNDPHFQPLIASVARSGFHTIRVPLWKGGRQAAVLQHHLLRAEVAAHNASFEERVLEWLGIKLDEPVIDTAVLARVAGAASSLENSAAQLLGENKLASGMRLIKLFCMPGKLQEDASSLAFDPKIFDLHPDEASEFSKYCDIDAELALKLRTTYSDTLSGIECSFDALTRTMNRRGWTVDMDLARRMQDKYDKNLEMAVNNFRGLTGADINLNSLKQMKEWCADRGVKMNSFDEANVARCLKLITKKLDTKLDTKKWKGLEDVRLLLQTKQELGGSSLKKLNVLFRTVSEGDKLRDQYIHCGAGQTLRTTGVGFQMQNLTKLSNPLDVSKIGNPVYGWDNDMLSANMRQLFTSSDPGGLLLVGDLSAIESRGLAFLAGEEWKVEAYRQGRKVYEALAAKIYSVPYESVTPHQRTTGKVGELSCGYGAGAEAVESFASKMGVDLVGAEAAQLVKDWRDADPKTVEFWDVLDSLLRAVVSDGMPRLRALAIGRVEMSMFNGPMAGGHPSLRVNLTVERTYDTEPLRISRTFHGVYAEGRSINYHRPSDRKGGDLWKPTFTDPKTKQQRKFSLYGGKLAGILTQSFARELFFRQLLKLEEDLKNVPNATLIGQFHDEAIVDWVPGPVSAEYVKDLMYRHLTDPCGIAGLPLGAEVKSSYRYTK